MNLRSAILSRIGNYLSDILLPVLLPVVRCVIATQAQIYVSPKSSDLAAGTGDICCANSPVDVTTLLG